MLKANWIDRAISVVAPGAALRRAQKRTAFDMATRGYDASKFGRLNAGWSSAASAPDVLIGANASALREHMRDLVRNNPHAAKGIAALVNNTVGNGITPRAKGRTPKVTKKISALWEKWSKQCDVEGQLDFNAMTTFAVREMMEAGEIITRRVQRDKSAGISGNMQLRFYEADQLDDTRNGYLNQDGKVTIHGVEFADTGGRTGYYLFPYHPNSGILALKNALVSEKVDASVIIHLYEKQRLQTRGVPWGTPAMSSLRNLGDYELAESVRKKIESCMVGVVTGGDESDMAINPVSANPMEAAGGGMGVVDAYGNIVERFEPGMFAYARGGRDIKFSSPSATGSYEAYKRSQLHSVAAGFRMPYELLTGDLSQVNYSSIRAGLIEFRRLIEALQWQLIIPTFCQRVWGWFVSAHVVSGDLSPGDVLGVEWSTPKFWSVDPLKDATADLLNLRMGSTTLFKVITERGEDAHATLEEIAEVCAMLDKLGLTLDSDPRKTNSAGQVQVVVGGDGSAGNDGTGNDSAGKSPKT